MRAGRSPGETVRILGHPLHTALVHFPIGLLGAVPLWDALAAWRGPEPWSTLAFWTLALGLASAIPAAGTGLLDYARLDEEDPAADRASQHLWTVLIAIALYAGSFGLRWEDGAPVPDPGWPAGSLGLAGLLFLGLAGWLGGELVLRHGVGAADCSSATSMRES